MQESIHLKRQYISGTKKSQPNNLLYVRGKSNLVTDFLSILFQTSRREQTWSTFENIHSKDSLGFYEKHGHELVYETILYSSYALSYYRFYNTIVPKINSKTGSPNVKFVLRNLYLLEFFFFHNSSSTHWDVC
ncbi:hypothetical protein PHYBLDRAFT_61930 [Phycomyces blakesleeanus NRRL 1555(-)]|uniref:Uncharacterized protein n=1 Tax=Phycomyces blakesleeanus (strain ATCC 8743b / DSM 1359 / FGSC 10004 / NBRC 33097 / NRRL 1555) TaxID=763407 RepID=A0A162Q846_PHYB8|nr:hypothetical protein PHYBLDRAFT_61930 [Phycomyces blakesleeanus NRRL 1555(-)]OAD80886.1 hypothetical protein PHYBLDRAFT_61930 [Phycomyces blakesleeanus NRRL 1555(-)]|eukprot:XP_018298926.1 hypothetical protein PHYBLDRAFT_61930 [Phycomyces blakesleeanus NRRL 1555(-)]